MYTLVVPLERSRKYVTRSKYDDLFDKTISDNSVFANKGALDPLAEPDEVVVREQERELATILNSVHED